MIISLTEAAKKHLEDLYENSEYKFIKISVSTKGCSGNSFDLKFIQEDQINPLDEQIQLENSFTLVIDFKSSMWLIGTEIDWKTDTWGSKFDFVNKNIEGTCGCGESFYFKNEKVAN